MVFNAQKRIFDTSGVKEIADSSNGMETIQSAFVR